MFFSNSAMIIRVINDFEENLKDFSFFEDNQHYESKKFFSISFYNSEKDLGEINFTNSFDYGKMNIINFMRKSNIFILFTSTPVHIDFFSKILGTLMKEDMRIELLKIKSPPKETINKKISSIEIVQYDKLYGLIGKLKFQDRKLLIKIYNNGLITFPFTNNRDLVEEVISTSLKFIEL